MSPPLQVYRRTSAKARYHCTAPPQPPSHAPCQVLSCCDASPNCTAPLPSHGILSAPSPAAGDNDASSPTDIEFLMASDIYAPHRQPICKEQPYLVGGTIGTMLPYPPGFGYGEKIAPAPGTGMGNFSLHEDGEEKEIPGGYSSSSHLETSRKIMKNTVPVVLNAPREDLDPETRAQDPETTAQAEAPTGQPRSMESMFRRTPPHLLNHHTTNQVIVESMLKRTPPHLMKQRNKNQCNIHKSYNITIARAAPPGRIGPYLYLPTISSSAAKTTTIPSSSLDKSGAHVVHDTPSEHQSLFLGEYNFTRVNLEAESHQFYPVVPRMNGNHSDYEQPPRYHCDSLGRKEQPQLPSYQSSQDDAYIRLTSSSVLGKRPVATNPAWSSFQQRPLDTSDDMTLAYGPQCELHTDDLLTLFQSMGTPEFPAISEKLLRSGSSLYEPCHVDDASLTPGNSSTVAAPSLHLSIGTGNSDRKGKGKGKEVSSYSDLSAMIETMESTKKQRQEYLPVRMLGSDGQGCSKNTMHRHP